MESAHSFGLSLFLFRILTSASTAHGLLLMSLVGLLPAFFKAVASENVTGSGRRNPTSRSRYISIVVDVVICLTLPVTVWIYDFVKSGTQWITDSDSKMFSGYTGLTIAGAFFFMGCGHWENFVDGRLIVRLKDQNIFKNFILKVGSLKIFPKMFFFVIIKLTELAMQLLKTSTRMHIDVMDIST